MIALIDADEAHHLEVRELYNDDPDAWVLPWAILPEVDYLLLKRAGPEAAQIFLADLAEERWAIVWGEGDDLERALQLNRRYQALRLGLVDGIVMAVAERVKATAIATLDLKHFGAVELAGRPRLIPRDGEEKKQRA